MSADNHIDDYWTQQSAVQEVTPEAHLNIKVVKNVEPLDEQFGLDALKIVPDSLYESLFGQVNPTQMEIEQARGDLAKVPNLQTYAILDAAKIPGLPELLVASGLDFQCLFQGDAFDELKDVAPWIVRLEDDSSFTRNLFTRSDAPWHLWDDEPGIFLRSRDTLNELRGHFRKFTKIDTHQNETVFFRFWDGVTWDALARTRGEDIDFLVAILSHHVIIYRSSVRLATGTFAIMRHVTEVVA